jgi:CheY-like chemotaxis protein
MGGGDAVDLTRDDRPVSILIADAHFASLKALEATLAPLGCRVLSAFSGEEVLELLSGVDCACVLLDVQLPGTTSSSRTTRTSSGPR